MPTDQKKALNTAQAAQFLAEIGTPFTAGTLEVWRCLGKGPRYRKVGQRVFYAPEDLKEYSNGQVVETTDTFKGV